MTPSTGSQRRCSRRSHRRAVCGESRMRRSGWGPPEKDPHCGHLAGGLPAPRASSTCPGSRGCWARWRAAPLRTPHTGWPGHLPRGGTQSGSSRSTCAASTPRAVRRMLPGAQIAVDLFHVVHLAVKMTGDVRRRVVRGKYGRRGRSGDPEYGIKNLLVRNLEHLSPAQFAKIGQHPAGGSGRAGDRRRLDREGETPPRAEPPRPRHRLGPVRARRPGPALRLLRLVRAKRRHPRAAVPGQDGIPVGRRDRLRGPDRRHERRLREPEPARQTRSPPGIRVPQPGKPAQAGPHRLHPRPPTQITHRNQQQNTCGNRTETPSRLTSKSHKCRASGALLIWAKKPIRGRRDSE